MKHLRKSLILLLLSLTPGCPLVAQDDFVVIVNRENPVTTLPVTEVSKIFLKKTTTWDHGLKSIPVDQSTQNPQRLSFSREILNRHPTAVKSYWGRMLYSGRATPPLELGTDTEIISYVVQNPGAIGYVSRAASLPKSVRPVEIVQ